jgi:hypothetical protein
VHKPERNEGSGFIAPLQVGSYNKGKFSSNE